MSAPEYTVEKKNAMVYKIRMKGLDGWADITIEEWEHGGSIKVVSDYGNYGYMWNLIGDQCLREFLIGLDRGYFMGKARGKYTKYDPEKTIKAIRADLIRQRRDGGFTYAEARELWEDIDQIDEDLPLDLMVERLPHSLFEQLFGCDYRSIPIEESIEPEVEGFWNIIWPAACDIWREELDINKI